MLKKERLFAPGPTALLPQAQAAMAAMHWHHRTAEFRKLLTGTRERLQRFLGTKNEVMLLAASGSGAMEAAVVNGLSPQDRVLVLTAGKFGERWEQLAKAYGCAVESVKLPYGESFGPQHVQGKVSAHTAAVLVQAADGTMLGAGAIYSDATGMAL